MNRKDDHINYALDQEIKSNDFDKMRFIHHALPNISLDEVNLSSNFCGFAFPYPFYINAMTGGSERAKVVNEKLSILANYFSIPMASGSLSIALKDPSQVNSFTVIRENYPKGVVMANLGADKTISDARLAKEMLDADIMQLHLNIVQEMIMPEGERNFTPWKENIREFIKDLDIPVIIKEVGFGMSRTTLEELKSIGARTIDVSGRGGTNFAQIENLRRNIPFAVLNDWGLSTVESLLEASNVDGIEILASGGIRNALDLVKALALGAQSVGLSSYFLKLVTNNSIEEAIEVVEQFILEIKTIMTILGAKTIKDLKNAEIVFDESLLNFIKQREINKTILIKR